MKYQKELRASHFKHDYKEIGNVASRRLSVSPVQLQRIRAVCLSSTQGAPSFWQRALTEEWRRVLLLLSMTTSPL